MTTRPSPRRVYLESTALFQLGPRLENVDFEKLLDLRTAAGFRVLVSEVSWLEYLRKRKAEIRVFLDSCSKAQRILEKHGKSIPEVEMACKRVGEYLSGIESHYRSTATKRGIEIVPLPSVKVDRLLAMSIECVPPFEEADDESKEKGFRDSLIMFSILESLRGCSNEQAVVVTKDKLLAKAFNLHAEECGASLTVVETLDKATEHISETIQESERRRLKEESAEAIRMLERYEEDIALSIYQIREFSESDLGQTVLAAMLPGMEKEYVDVRGVKSVSFERIDSALWKSKKEPVSRILFRCVCRAIVFAAAPYLRPWRQMERHFRVGEQPSNSLMSIDLGGAEPTVEKELRLHFYGTAELERSGSDWRLTQLRIDKALPPEEEYDTLVAAEILPTETQNSESGGS